MTRHRRHHRQHGQVLVVTALMATLIIGVAALAVDVSMQTSNRRTLQNLGDVAALAGARDLARDGSTVTDADKTNAIADALRTVQREMSWPDSWTTSSSLDNCANFPTPTMIQFGLAGHCEQASYNGYTVTASTPPMSPRTLGDMDVHNVQVDITQGYQNGLAGVIGFAASQEGGHAVGRHMNGGTALPFALFSNTYIQAGNGPETVWGNVYAAREINPQSSGNSSFCAQSTGVGDGYIILGAPQTSSSGQQTVRPTSADVFQQPPGNNCANVSGSAVGVFQTGAVPSCPTIPGVPDTLSYNSAINACVTLPLTPPVAAPPPQTGSVTTIHQPCRGGGGGNGGHGSGFPSCWGSGTSVPGNTMYVVYPNNTASSPCVPTSCWDLLITAPMTLTGVTFWLMPGASMGVNMSGSGGLLEVTTPYNANTGQGNDGKFVIYGQGGSQLQIVGNNNNVLIDQGSIYMPGGTVSGSSSSASLRLAAGQAVVDTWAVSTGNQPNPQITYSSAFTPVSTETLRLTE